ncbi:Uncharacterised protein [Mycobacteroides abscessus subsp. abscessus]|nr:Uncharacterised protein [Mycobacteroides abscessus subsp. abscessus]
MEGHRDEEHEQAQRVGEPLDAGVDADEGLGEEVAGGEEVDDHELVAEMPLEGVLHQPRVVEDDEGTGEVDRGDDRIGEEAHVGGVDEPEHPFADAAGAIGARGRRPHEQGDRGAEDHRDGHDHDEEHVLDHVRRERHLAVDLDAARSDVDEADHSEHPADEAEDRPGVASATELEIPGDVRDRQPHGDDDPQRVDRPLGEEAGEVRCGGQRLSGEDLRGRRVAHRLLRDGRLGAGEGDGQAHRRSEDDELDEDEAPELARHGGDLAEPGDDEPAVPEADEPEEDRREGLRDDDLAVWGHEIREVLDAQHRVDDAGEGDDDEREERDRRVAGDERPQLGRLGEAGAEQGDDEETAEPQGDAEEVESDAVDGLRVARRLGGVAHEGEGDHHAEREDAGEGEAEVGPGAEAQRRGDGDEDDDEGPVLAEGDLGEEDAELVREVEVGLRTDGGDEGEEEDGDSGDRPRHRGDLGDFERLLPERVERRLLVLLSLPAPDPPLRAGQDEEREEECADGEAHREVEDELRGRQSEADDGSRVVDDGRLGGSRVEHRDESDGCAEECDERDRCASGESDDRLVVVRGHRGPPADSCMEQGYRPGVCGGELTTAEVVQIS